MNELSLLQLCENIDDAEKLNIFMVEVIEKLQFRHIQFVVIRNSNNYIVVVTATANYKMDHQDWHKLNLLLAQYDEFTLCIAGIGFSGYIIAEIVSDLKVNAVIYDGPTDIELTHNIKHFVAEGQGVLVESDQIFFVKTHEDIHVNKVLLSKWFLSDENGGFDLCSQNEYGQFSSWVYKHGKSIDHGIWEMFFGVDSTRNNLEDKELLHIYLVSQKIKGDHLENSLDKSIKHIRSKCESRMSSIQREVIDIYIKTDKSKFEEVIEEYFQHKSIELISLINKGYDSMTTIFIGCRLLKIVNDGQIMLLQEKAYIETQKVIKSVEKAMINYSKVGLLAIESIPTKRLR